MKSLDKISERSSGRICSDIPEEILEEIPGGISRKMLRGFQMSIPEAIL